MPWEGVTVSEQRQNFIRDYVSGIYSRSELAKAFSISRKTAYKWIKRFNDEGRGGLEERSRRPHSCPWQTDDEVVQEIVRLRKARPRMGPKKLIVRLKKHHWGKDLPAISTVAHIISREGLAKKPPRHRRAHPGCPKSVATGPNDIWAADYKGQFRLRNGQYCFPLTVSDLHSRYLLGCDAHPEVSTERTKQYFLWLFRTYGLPNRIRTDNGVPFASCALARLSQLSAWWIKLGIYPELIEPGKPQQNGIHERMHRTMKQEATIPPSGSLRTQQARFDAFRREFNTDRPHEALQMACPGEVYRRSRVHMPSGDAGYEYPGHFVVRRVSRCGTIRVFRNQIFVTQVLNEESVGLEEVEDGIYDLYFCFYLIGRYDLRTNKIHDIISKVPTAVRSADRPKGCHPCP
jgi:transposase InsO family protein